MAETAFLERTAVVVRGRRFEYFTVASNAFASALAASISLIGFAIDSFLEATSGAFLLRRISVDADVRHCERNERRAFRVVGISFLSLAAYIAFESAMDLWSKRAPEHSVPG